MADRSIQLAKNRAWPLLERLNTALEAGAIDEAQWYEHIAAVIVPAYLAGEDPRAQSGSSGDDEDWTYKRSLIAEAIDRDGSFLDVGCASGYLMETLTRWCRDRGHTIEPYGLDIAPALADLARRRLPHWAQRIFVGNAIDWTPPHRFTFVRTGLEYVPPGRQRALVEQLLGEVVAPGGRLIIGVYSEEHAYLRTEPAEVDRVARWGFAIAGRAARPHPQDPRLAYHVFWIARSADHPLVHHS
jgi:SAM-dependent methyltransferase